MKPPPNFQPSTCGQENEDIFWNGLNPQALERKYWQVSKQVFEKLTVSWDQSKYARYQNCEAEESYLNRCKLFECDAFTLFDLLDDNYHYCFSNVWQEVNKKEFLRVVGHWDLHKSLSPPVLEQTNEGTFRNNDGFHRLVVAFAANAPRIPFYTVLHKRNSSIREVNG